jgi:hypothetical protein
MSTPVATMVIRMKPPRGIAAPRPEQLLRNCPVRPRQAPTTHTYTGVFLSVRLRLPMLQGSIQGDAQNNHPSPSAPSLRPMSTER